MAKKGKYYKLSAELLSYGITPRAMVLYAVLADRAELSKGKQEFTDERGTYIIYKREDICSVLNIGKRTADYAIAELEDAGLLVRKRQGKTLPVRIYVQEPGSERSAKNSASGSAKNCASGSAKNCAYNYTDSNYTEELSSSGKAGTGRGLVKLIGLIDSIAAAEHITLDDDQVYKLIKKVRKQGQKIGNLQGWLRAAVRNADMLPKGDPEPEGYAPTYDIAEYESTSILDEE